MAPANQRDTQHRDTNQRDAVAYVYCHPDEKQEWQREADRNHYHHFSDYLRDCIQETHVLRRDGYLSHQHADKRLHDLENEVDRLESQLEHARDDSDDLTTDSLAPAVDDTAFLKQVLSDEYQSLADILQTIVESGVLDRLIRQKVENQLYVLAQQDVVEYERGFGWRLTNGGDQS